MIGFRETVRLGTRVGLEADEEGRTDPLTTWVDVEGRVDELSAKEVALAAQSGQTHDIIVQMGREVPVTDRQVVEVTDPTRLAGTYLVDAIQTTRRHLRVFCSRVTVKD